ncbi:hypothetical protein [Sodalis-like endosymbiont of Proechinophthirus fluctus]|uniref:hypothetical protein n=1 Tax=Sodalis-like endosymbiont of Proechinophthirus fluctus TaxID=1462730 RepID=UPI000830087F|nr:hypothetical protein [Sodalis-like endosymbiont of Proechinophthirus fluctus]
MIENFGSNWLYLMVKPLAEEFSIYQRVLLFVTAEQGERNNDHNELLQAILNGNADVAIIIMLEYLIYMRDVMLKALNNILTLHPVLTKRAQGISNHCAGLIRQSPMRLEERDDHIIYL